MENRVRALGLHSGGLDGELAGALLASLGLEVRFVHFRTGFAREDRAAALERRAAAAGGAVRTVDLAADYFRGVVTEPRYGCGAGMDACVDCRILMLRRAGEIARTEGFDVLFTGEVLGQRPRDQGRAALERTAREAGVEDLLLRPLCARKLPETRIEREGRVDRAALGGLHGRSRREQFALAARLGVEPYPTPSGGCCRLADRGFARRLRDHLDHGEPVRPSDAEIRRLDRGRHFRLAWNLKLVVGRDEFESAWLDRTGGPAWRVQVAGGHGALGLLLGEADERGLELAARLAARYSRQRGAGRVAVVARRGAETLEREVEPAPEALLARLRL